MTIIAEYKKDNNCINSISSCFNDENSKNFAEGNVDCNFISELFKELNKNRDYNFIGFF